MPLLLVPCSVDGCAVLPFFLVCCACGFTGTAGYCLYCACGFAGTDGVPFVLCLWVTGTGCAVLVDCGGWFWSVNCCDVATSTSGAGPVSPSVLVLCIPALSLSHSLIPTLVVPVAT
jgi:hypothetical protein